MTLSQFKQHIQKQQMYYRISIMTLVIFNAIFIYFFVRHQENYFGYGFIIGFTIALLYVLSYYSIQNKKALASKEALQQLYIKRLDERQKAIKQSAFTLSTRILLCLLALTAACFTFVNLTIAYVIIVIIYTSFIIYGLCYFYLSRRH